MQSRSRDTQNINLGLIGLAFDLKKDGGLVLDIREGKERVVGGIIPDAMNKGYTVCSFVKKSIVFDTFVPETVRTPKRMQDWIQQHAVSWNNLRRYTLFNPVVGFLMLIGAPRFLNLFKDAKTQIAVMQCAITLFLVVYHHDSLIGMGIATVLGIFSVTNVVTLMKNYF